MKLGLANRKAIVCGSTAGLGLACAKALLDEDVEVVINGRSRERLDDAVAALSVGRSQSISGVVADVGTAGGRAALLAACPDADILITNSAGPEPASFETLDELAWRHALEASLIAPLMLIRALVPGMRERRFGRIVNISSAMVTSPRSGLALSSGSRAGVIAALKAYASDVACDNVIINHLSPERFDTDRQQRMAAAAVARDGITPDAARARQIATIPAGRLGDPAEFGATCAFLCSAQAGYMTAMNVRLDGGSFPGLF